MGGPSRRINGITPTIGFSFSFGGHGSNIDYRASLNFSLAAGGDLRVPSIGMDNMGNFFAAYGVEVAYYSNFLNTQVRGFEVRQSVMAGWSTPDRWKLDAGIVLGSNFWNGLGQMREFKQQTGMLDLRFGKVDIMYENDGYPLGKQGSNWQRLGDGNDSYRTAAVRVSIGDDFAFGTNLFTGRRTEFPKDEEKLPSEIGSFGEWMPHGYVQEEGTPYRAGILYAEYRGQRVGIDSDRWVRHPFQNILAHHLISPQPGFETLSDNVMFYYQLNAAYYSSYQFRLTPLRFTSYDH